MNPTSHLNLFRVRPSVFPSGKESLRFRLATSSTTWYLIVAFSYPSFRTLKEVSANIFKGTTGRITSRLLKSSFGKDEVPRIYTSRYLDLFIVGD